MPRPLSVQKVLQAERFSAGRLHHVAKDSRPVTPSTGLAGKKKCLAYHLSFHSAPSMGHIEGPKKGGHNFLYLPSI